MRFILRWFIRLFGIFVFVRGSWMLHAQWHIHPLDMPRRIDEVNLSDLRDTLHLVENFVAQSSFLLALSGFIIIVLAFRR